jgi:hypothetical protein
VDDGVSGFEGLRFNGHCGSSVSWPNS